MSQPSSSVACGGWSREDEKAMENALASLPPSTDGSDSWMQEVASMVPGKPLSEVRRYYEFLVEDVRAIEAGKIAFPCYIDDDDKDKEDKDKKDDNHHQQHQKLHQNPSGFGDRKGFDSGRGSALSKAEQERRKGIPWTEEEHKLFLLGLSKFGKGDWRSISRNFVISRTPTQVASHAQKYFIRLNSMNRDRRRSSIHDITSINAGDSPPPHQRPITGQTGGAPAPKQLQQPPPPGNLAAMGVYGQPVTVHMVSAVGTPVMLPHGHPHYVVPMAYPPPTTAMRRYA